MSENTNVNKSEHFRSRITEGAISLVVAVVVGVLSQLIVNILVHLRLSSLQSPQLILGLAVIIVLCLLITFGTMFKRKLMFWLITGIAIVLAGILAWLTVVQVPNVIGMSLTDAKTLVANAGLAFEEVEMVKGGSMEVGLQYPNSSTHLFKGSLVKIFFGKKPLVEITSPKNGDSVSSHLAEVEGISQGVFGSSDFHIWVLVRPQNNHVWIQDSPDIEPSGKFSIMANFGTPELGRGEPFRVQAIVTNEHLKTGDHGTDFPSSINCSSVIRVTRSR